jgi:hypothetical protein
MWLSPIVRVSKENGKLKICVCFRKLNATTKKTHIHHPSLMKNGTELQAMVLIEF